MFDPVGLPAFLTPGMNRRRAMGGLGLIAGGAMLPCGLSLAASFVSQRPRVQDRRFVSPAVEAEIERVRARIADPELAWIFANCFPNTLDTTTFTGKLDGGLDTFVITGDIPALWLRDSSAQVWPYLPLAKGDKALTRMFRGLIRRHARCVLIDPYANAFLRDPNSRQPLPWSVGDKTVMHAGVGERKWEVDSLAHVLRLAWGYWRMTGDKTPFDTQWRAAARLIVATLRTEQRLDNVSPYTFQRMTDNALNTLMLDGHGAPTRKTGLVHSMFRPSDDACVFPFLIPANIFAARALRWLAQVANEACGDTGLANDASLLAENIEAALRVYGRIGEGDSAIWAYEVDGYGNALFMDDANIPSLSGLAYLGCVERDDPVFRRTEARCWSEANPWFVRDAGFSGIGGPHTGQGRIWPMSMIVRAFSSDDDAVIRACLAQLKASHAGTGFFHEAFLPSDPRQYTRPWFSWVNSLFGEMIRDLADRRPQVLSQPV